MLYAIEKWCGTNKWWTRFYQSPRSFRTNWKYHVKDTAWEQQFYDKVQELLTLKAYKIKTSGKILIKNPDSV